MLQSGESGMIIGQLHAVDLGSLEDVLFRGLYPRLYSADTNPRRLYESYIRTYLERDVRSIRDVGDLSTFQRFLRVCAGRVGQVVNYSSIGDDLGLSHNTVRAWMSVVEASYVVQLLRPFHRNFGKQTTKSPRLYFVDTGLVCALLEIDSPGSLRKHHLRGAIFENLVVNEIAKAFVNEAKREPLSYWRDRRGNEVDLLVEKAENRVAVEAKAGMTIAGTWFRGLSYYGNLDPPCPPENRYVVYGSDSLVSVFRDFAASSSTGWAITGTIANPRSSSVWRGKRSEQFNTPGHSVVNFVSGETWKWVPVETDSTAKRRSTA
jgi:hypothetical protein